MSKENSKQELGPVVAQACVLRPRERIVASAQDLFHRHGIRGVGVDAIAEAAGTNKMTLYRHFGSKDDLILEYLNYKGKKSDEIWAEIEAESPDDPAGHYQRICPPCRRKLLALAHGHLNAVPSEVPTHGN